MILIYALIVMAVLCTFSTRAEVWCLGSESQKLENKIFHPLGQLYPAKLLSKAPIKKK